MIGCREEYVAATVIDIYIGRSLDLYGEWCDTEPGLLSQVINPGDVVLDVGANIGSHTVCFGNRTAPDGIVMAFEPQRINHQLLCANIALNALSNVFCIQKGVGDRPGTASVPVMDPSSESNLDAIEIGGNGDLTEECDVITIDGLGLRKCNLIKVDVEGMETKVLEGASQTIKALQPVLFVENNKIESSSEIISAVFELGYQCGWHIATYYNPNNYFQNHLNAFGHAVEVNMICAPKEFTVNYAKSTRVLGVDDNWRKAIERSVEKPLE